MNAEEIWETTGFDDCGICGATAEVRKVLHGDREWFDWDADPNLRCTRCGATGCRRPLDDGEGYTETWEEAESE